MSDALRELSVAIDFNDIDMSRLTRMDRAIDSIERNVRDLGGDINRLGTRVDEAGTEGSRAMDRLGRHTEDVGDSMDELRRETDDAMDEMRRGAGSAADAIQRAGDRGERSADDIRASSDRAADALRDMGNAGERAAGDVIRAGGRADSELEDLTRTAGRAGDALEELGDDAAKLNHLTQVLDNVNGRIAIQERKLAGLRESLNNTFNESQRERLTEQILRAENALLGLTRQSDRTAREIWKIEDAMREAANRADRMGADVTDAMNDIRRGADRAADAVDELGDASREAGESGAKGGGKFLDVLNDVVPQGRAAGMASMLFSNPWVAAAAAVVAATIGIGVAIAGMVNDADKDFDRLQAKLGATDAQMSGIKDTVLDVYKSGFGEGIGDVADGVASLKQNFKQLDDESIGTLTKGAYTLKDLFGPEVKETSKAIKTMTANFKGLSETDAMDLITTGFQKGGDYADDFLDTVNEYSVYFNKLGVSADKFVGTLIEGGNAGAFNLDKVGDSFKELSIRAIDGSDTTVDAFKSLGFDAKKMGQDFAAGGSTAEHALMATVSALSFVSDEQERNRIGVELFGTQWEDMRENVIFSIDGAEKAVEGFQGATERATQTMQDNVGSKWTQITRGFKAAIIDAFDGGGNAMGGLLDKVLQVMPSITAGIQSAIDWVQGIFAENQDEIAKYTDGIASFFTGLWSVIQGIWNIIGPYITGVFSDSLGVVWTVAGTILGAVGDLFSIFGNLLQGNWGAAWQSVKDLFSGVMNGLLDIGASLLNMVFGVFDNTIGRIINLFTNFSLRETGMNIVNGLIDGIKSMAGQAVEAIGNVASSMWGKVKDFFGIASPSKLLTEAGQWIIEGLTNGIKNMGSKAVESVKDVASNIWGGVKNFFGIHSPSKLMAEAGGFIVEGLQVGIDDNAMRAVDAAKDLSKGIEAAASVSPPAAALVPETPEVAALVQPEPDNAPQGKPAPQGGPQPGTPTPDPSGFDFPTPPTAPTTPPVQVSFGDIIVQMPEGATKKEAQDFGAAVAQEVRAQVAALFTQLGIALP